MDWLAQNWLWVLFAAAFIAMHLFGHGGHGGPFPSGVVIAALGAVKARKIREV